MTHYWRDLDGTPPISIRLGSVELRAGSRVRLQPCSRASNDAMDLTGRTAVVEGIDQDFEGHLHVGVVLDDEPGRDLGRARAPGHRFYFAPEELEPLPGAAPPRILVAGVGNVFLGDDGFGVEVVRQLAGQSFEPGVEVVDFGIRGMDLVYALQSNYEAVVLIDATPRGGHPGTLYVIEPDIEDEVSSLLHGHGMDPMRALTLARALGARLGLLRIVGCEPAQAPSLDVPLEEMSMELSEPVRAALPSALELATSVVKELLSELAPPQADERSARSCECDPE